MTTYIIRDECGCETLAEGLTAAVKSIKEADWGDSPYAVGWEKAREEVPEPTEDSADALNDYVAELAEAAELHAVGSVDGWCQGNYEQHLANTSVPFAVEVYNDA